MNAGSGMPISKSKEESSWDDTASKTKHPQKTKNREYANNIFSIKKLKLKVRFTNEEIFSDQTEIPNLEEVARAVAVCEDPKQQQLEERALKQATVVHA
jgi:hypothetical protein